MTSTNLLAAAHLLRDGAACLTFDQFADALRGAVGADKLYARGVWNRFQDDPAGFLASRSPQTQSEAIITVMLSNLSLHK